MAALSDINVLLPLIHGAHIHHRSASSWVNQHQEDGELVLCRISQLGILHLLNNPTVMGSDAKGGSEAWEIGDALLADSRFRFADEPEGIEDRFRILSDALSLQPKRWQDVYLAAFALAAGLEMVTFDSGFRSFPNLRYRILKSETSPR